MNDQKVLTDELAGEIASRLRDEGLDVRAICLAVVVDEGETCGTTMSFAPLDEEEDLKNEDAECWTYLAQRLREGAEKSFLVGEALYRRRAARAASRN